MSFRQAKTPVCGSPLSIASNFDDESVGVLSPPAAGGKKGKVRKESEHKRRLMMNQYFDELVTLLSMVTDLVSTRKMDKTTTLHEAVKLFRLYYHLDQSQSHLVKTERPPSQPGYKPNFLNRGEVTSFLLDAMNAFVILVSENGRVLYSTDLITSLTGYMPSRMVGQSIYDCIHVDDHALVKELMTTPISENEGGASIEGTPVIAYPSKSFQCRFKIYSTDTASSAVSCPFSCLSYLRKWKEMPDLPSPSLEPGEAITDTPPCCLLLIGKLDDSLVPIDHPVTGNSANFQFEFRISKEGKILDMSEHASLILGYTSSDLVGLLFFDLVDPFHLEKVSESMSVFLTKGMGVSQPYRLVSKSQRYFWIVSKGFLSYNPWNHKPDHVLLQCKVLGCDEVPNECRFSQDKCYQPDLWGLETYQPEPIKETASKSHHPQNPAPHVGGARTHHGTARSNMAAQQSEPMPTQSVVTNAELTGNDLFVSPLMVPPPPPPPPLLQENSLQLLNNVRQELEKKNRELFEMQKMVLAQQQLIDQERRQFYQITNQVMSFIGSQQTSNQRSESTSGGDPLDGINIHPGMAMMIRNARSEVNSTAPSSSMNMKMPGIQLEVTSSSTPTSISHHQQSFPQYSDSNTPANMQSPMSSMPTGHVTDHMTNQMTSRHSYALSPMTSDHMMTSPGHVTNSPMTSHNMMSPMSSAAGHMTSQHSYHGNSQNMMNSAYANKMAADQAAILQQQQIDSMLMYSDNAMAATGHMTNPMSMGSSSTYQQQQQPSPFHSHSNYSHSGGGDTLFQHTNLPVSNSSLFYSALPSQQYEPTGSNKR